MNGDEWFRLTKVDAAQRQLDMASFLFMVSCEYVSIHALGRPWKTQPIHGTMPLWSHEWAGFMGG